MTLISAHRATPAPATPVIGRATRRRGSDVVRGLASIAVLAAVLLGVPWLLLHAGWPIVPAWLRSAHGAAEALQLLLTTPDDGSLFLGVMTAVGWLAWATFTVAVLTEIVAAASGRLPRRLPLLAPQQRVAGGLVAAVIVLASGQLALAAPPAVVDQSAVVAAATATDPVPELVLVQRGDTLWSIAKAETGHGSAYRQIADATRGLPQPGGRTLQDPDQIYPGWTVVVPRGSGRAPEQPTAPASPAAAPTSASPAVPTPSGAASDPSTPSAAAPTASADATSEALAEPGVDDDLEVVEVAVATGVGVLTAAGLLSLLRRRRTQQRRHRRAGQRIPTPPTPVRDLQRDLVAAHAPLTLTALDSALQHLSRRCRQQRVALPRLQLVRLMSDHVELHLAAPMPSIAPFAALGQADSVWTALPSELLSLATLTSEDEPAPYPTLMALGSDLDGAQVLVDLEEAGGLRIHDGLRTNAATGEGVTADAVAAALVVELATTTWGEEIDVVVVGGHRELVEALDVDRMRWTADVDHVAVELRTWAEAVHAAVLGFGWDDVSAADARGRDTLRELLRPRVVVVDDVTGAVLADVALQLRATTPTLPLSLVRVGGRAPLTQVQPRRDDAAPGLELLVGDDDGRAQLNPVGLTLRPHHIDAVTHQRAVAALQCASAPPGAPATPPTAAPLPGDSTGERAPSGSAVDIASLPAQRQEPPKVAETPPCGDEHPVIALLGPVEVRGARGEVTAQRHTGSMLEALAFMALHPQRERYAFDQALWPHERVPDSRRQQLVSRARRWLGTDDEGAPYVPLVNPDGYRLADAVTTDWHEFQALAASPLTAPTDDLERAMRLVRGQPFSGHSPRRYGWADDDAQEMIAAITDVAHELAVRAHRDGDAPRARRAAVKGLLIEPSSEMLWRDALGAEFLAGNRAGLEAMTDRFLAMAQELGDDFEPETDELLKELFSRLPHLDPSPPGGERRAS